jgi:iron complex transport system ATP-binding protein
MRLSLERVTCGYGARDVVHNVSFTIEAGNILCVLGANGSGKTTLFKAILGLLPLRSGRVCLDGSDLASWSRRRLAQAMAYVPQAHTPPFAFTVRDVITMGRTSRLEWYASPGHRDEEAAEAAIHALKIPHLANARYTELSGGERQLVLIARALAQEPKILVMDEPASSLDFGNQFRMLSQVRHLATRGLTLLMTTHSPNHAFQCASRVLILEDGRLLAEGRPDDTLTEANLQRAYGVPLRVMALDENQKTCVPAPDREE